jgi:Flp pilus assembly protein protease CpaA
MLIDQLLIPLTLFALMIASYTDLKTREVPDLISYGYLAAILGIQLIFSFEFGYMYFVGILLGTAICVILALILYHTNQWGGADSKLLMGMGALFGVALPFTQESFTLAWFFGALLLSGAIYGVLWMVGIALLHHTKFGSVFKKRHKKEKKIQLIMLVTTISIAIVSYFLPGFWLFLLFPFPFYYLYTFVRVVEQSCFIRKIPVSKLTLGDWLAMDVEHNNKTILEKKTIEKEDLALLHKYHVPFVTVKEGIPFVPSFLIAYLLILILL